MIVFKKLPESLPDRLGGTYAEAGFQLRQDCLILKYEPDIHAVVLLLGINSVFHLEPPAESIGQLVCGGE